MTSPVVTFAGLTFETAGFAATSAGGRLGLTGLSGWWDSPPPDVASSFAHPSGDGLLSEGPRMGARTIEVAGVVRADDPDVMLATLDLLMRARYGTFKVSERTAGPTRLATVRRVDLKVQYVSANYRTFNLFLRADDPLRYGATSRTIWNGGPTISNDGDQTAYPVLTLEGPHDAIEIEHPGGTYRFAAVPSGQTRVLDFRNGDVWNGQARVFGAESGPRPEVRPGGSQWHVSGLGAGTALLERYEAWT